MCNQTPTIVSARVTTSSRDLTVEYKCVIVAIVTIVFLTLVKYSKEVKNYTT